MSITTPTYKRYAPSLGRRIFALTLTPGMPILAMLAVVVALTSLFPGDASAATAGSKLRIDAFGLVYSDGSYEYDFVGGVGIRKLRAFPCVAHREIRFYRDVPDGPDTSIGSDKTNLFGFADLVLKHPDMDTLPGRYYGVLKPARKKTRHGRLRCRGDRSRDITVQDPDFYQPGSGSTKADARIDTARGRNDA
jgi:hypothetical protein